MDKLSEKNYHDFYRQLKNGQSLTEICDNYELTPKQAEGLIEMLRVREYDIDLIVEDNEVYIKKKNIYQLNKKIKPSRDSLTLTELCVVSDTHLCTTIQQLSLLNEIYLEANRRGIKTVLHCGDVIDGDYTKVRPAHQYEIFRRGFDQQTEYVIDMYPKINGMHTYFIEGSHDQTHVKNGGATPGKWIDKLRPDMTYLGTPEYTMNINKIKIRMQHPGGGSARSLSYKPQIAIDEMETGEKPNMFLQGHFHKSYGCNYRNVHAYLVPSLMNQSGFMAMNNISNIVGAYFFNIYSDKQGHIEYLDVDPILFDKQDINSNDYLKCKRLVIK